jgi:glucokinase
MILAGDIGGTSSRLGSFEVRKGKPRLVELRRYSSQQYRSLEEIVRAFVVDQKVKVQHACFGVAGPVRGGHTTPPNLPWSIEVTSLERELGLSKVWLINDLEANAYGIAALEPADLFPLNQGTPDPDGNAGIISAGTGLGEAGYYFDGKRYRPFATEGGHADFAPRNELEVELFLYLLKQFKRVSCERVLSGPGLTQIYRFLSFTGRGQEPAWLAEEMRQGDPSAVVAERALDGRSELCGKALDMFVSIYGAEAGNLALKFKATRAVFVGGGIAPKIIQKLAEPGFIQAFVDKDPMRPLLEAIPVTVILNDRAALLGAATFAALEAGLMEHPLIG